jgi:hypothetical protein
MCGKAGDECTCNHEDQQAEPIDCQSCQGTGKEDE